MLRFLLVALLAVAASAFQLNVGRRQAIGAAVASFGLAGSAQAAEIRKANQEAIGVSRVEKLEKGVGAKGVQTPVKLDYGYESKSAVLGPNGASGNSGPKGFFAGGEPTPNFAGIGKK